MSSGWKRFLEFLDAPASFDRPFGIGRFPARALLRKSLEFILPTTVGDATEPVEDFLHGVRVDRLFDVDERMRRYNGTVFRAWPDSLLAAIAASSMAPSIRQSLLFLAAGHGNGHKRQSAVELLPHFPGRLSLAAVLIRCGDWVPQIRIAAQRNAVKLLELCDIDDVVAVWPLVLRLQSRGRVDGEWFRSTVEDWLLTANASGVLTSLLQSSNSKVRAWAHEKCFAADIPLAVDLLDSAIRDSSPGIAMLAIDYSLKHCDASRAAALARCGMDAPHPATRRESLRALANLERLPRELVCKALLDRSAGVRSLAAYLLRETYAESAVDHWREVIDRGLNPGVLASLSDVAQAEDISRFKRWLGHPKGTVQFLCLRGIVKAGGELSDREFLQVVAGTGTRLRRAVADAVRRGKIPLDSSRLMFAATAQASTALARKHLRELLRELNHWDRLSLVLDIRPDNEAELLWFVTVLGDWIADSNRYAPLGPARRSSLLGLLDTRREEMDRQAFRQIEGAIGRH